MYVYIDGIWELYSQNNAERIFGLIYSPTMFYWQLLAITVVDGMLAHEFHVQLNCDLAYYSYYHTEVCETRGLLIA